MSFLHNYQILIVDDLVDNLFLLQFFLEDQGYQVDTATEGRTALTKIQASPPSLLLLDVMMPEMNGFEVAQCLRQDNNLSSMNIVLITADRAVDLNQALAAGANDIIHKPINFDELLSRVKIWCQ